MNRHLLALVFLPSLALAADSLSVTPGNRKAVQLSTLADPFADLNSSAPSVRSTEEATPETRAKNFSGVTDGLRVTAIVMTNDPTFRAVSINRTPLKQGQEVPAELFAKDPGGKVFIRAIESDKITYEMTLPDGQILAADAPYTLGARAKRKK